MIAGYSTGELIAYRYENGRELWSDALAKTSRAPVKAFLLDQRRIAGLGNIYVSEALFRAGLDPSKQASRLANQHVASRSLGVVRP